MDDVVVELWPFEIRGEVWGGREGRCKTLWKFIRQIAKNNSQTVDYK